MLGNWGDKPENTTCAGTPPTRTTGFVRVVSLTGEGGTPFGGVTVTGPSPVARSTRVAGSPIFAGRELYPGKATPAGRGSVLSLLLYAAGRETPVLSCVTKNSPGATLVTWIVTGAELPPLLVTTTCAVPVCAPVGRTFHGI